MALKGSQDLTVVRGRAAPEELTARRDPQVPKDRAAPRGLLVLGAYPERASAYRAPEGHKDHQDLQDLQDLQDCGELSDRKDR